MNKENLLSSILFYNLYTQIKNGSAAPEKAVLSDICKELKLTVKDCECAAAEHFTSGHLADELSDCINLLGLMQKKGSIDNESIDIIVGILKSLKESTEHSVYSFIEEVMSRAEKNGGINE